MMTRDIWVKWEEPYRDDEIVHQLERGQKRPAHARRGLVLQFFPHVGQVRVGGLIESQTMLSILDEESKQVIVKPLTSVKFIEATIPPLPSPITINDTPRSPTNFSDTPYLSG